MKNRKRLSFETKQIIDGKGLSLQNLARSLLLMHPSTMKKINLFKNCLILLYSGEKQLLFKCWSCPSVPQDSILLPSFSYFCKNLQYVTCAELYKSPVDVASLVILSCDAELLFMKTKVFHDYLQTHLDQFYLSEGAILSMLYLGQKLCFTVTCIQSVIQTACEKPNLDDICSDLSLLDISGDISNLEPSSHNQILSSTPISKNLKSVFDESLDLELKDTEILSKFYLICLNTSFQIESSANNKNILNHKFEDLVGLEEQIDFMDSVVKSLLNEDFMNKAGIILFGPSGTGKTSFIQAMLEKYQLPLFDVKSCFNASSEAEMKFQLQHCFKEATQNFPSIIFIDDLDSSLKNIPKSKQGWMMAFLSSLIFDVSSSKSSVLVIAAVQNLTEVDPNLRKPGTLERELHFKVPSNLNRRKILQKILCKRNHNLAEKQILELADVTSGFTGGDLKLLCDKALSASLKQSDKDSYCITFEDLKTIAKDMAPSCITEFKFEKPNVKWSDIGGMQDVKTAIIEMVDWPLKHAEQFKKFKIVPSKGILLYGPPGCSKTMIAKALVTESHLNFISIKGPQLFNKYVGESEKAVSDLFKKARSAAPCIIFFDEIDTLATVKGSTSGNSSVVERVLTQLLIEVDGIDVLQGVSIIAATNRPEMIDPSFLRPGRFDQMIYVPLPDSTTRREIFRVKLEKMPVSSDVDVSYLVEATEGYTGAEITDVCNEAAMLVIQDYISTSAESVSMHHFLAALKSVAPRTSKNMIEYYESYSKRSIAAS